MNNLVRSRELLEPRASVESALWLTVVFTTVDATKRALQYSSELATDLGARIHLIIPQVVPYPLPLHRPAVDPERTVRHFTGITDDLVRIDVVLCRDSEECLLQQLPGGCAIVIGPGMRWWPGRVRHLSRSLCRAGHQVIIAPTNFPACRRTTKETQA